LLLALVPQLIGHSSFNWALARLPAVFVAVATLGEPIGSAILAYLFLGEMPTLLKISGAALILAGIALTLFASPTARPMDATIN
jgi:drug/metabolite transporter (DMT)-like permease